MRIETHRSIIVGACLAGLSAVSAAQVGQVAPGSVRIDGVSDEAAWASAPVHEIRHSLGGEAPTVATRFRLATDGEALLVAAECEQPDMGSLRAAGTTRDAAVWQDDCIEVFLDPTGRGIEYVQYWAFVAVRWDGTGWTLFVNGAVAAAETAPALSYVPPAATVPLNLGGYRVQTNNVSCGLLDEVRLWDTALSDEQVAAVMLSDIRDGRWPQTAEPPGGRAVQGDAAIVPKAPVAEYRFESVTDNLTPDSSDSGGTARVHGASAIAAPAGRGLLFNGTDSYVDCGNSPALNLATAVSVECWVRPDALPDGEVGIAGKGRVDDGQWHVERSAYGLTFYRNGNVYWYIADGVNHVSAGLGLGIWQHVVGTYDGKAMRLYLNGAQVGLKYLNVPIPAGGNFFIGATGRESGVFAGGVAGVRLYDYALSPESLQYRFSGMSAAVQEKPQPVEGGRTMSGDGYTLRVGEDGAMQVSIGMDWYVLRSHFSYPGESIGWNDLGGDGAAAEPAWQPKAEAGKDGELVLTAAGAHYSLRRVVRLDGHRIVVSDTLTNTTQADVGVIYKADVAAPSAFTERLLSGDNQPGEHMAAENPTVYVAQTRSSLGWVAEDALLRLQLATAAGPNQAIMSASRFALQPGRSHAFQWAVYPQGAGSDYWAFINQIRRDWKMYTRLIGPWAWWGVSSPSVLERVRNPAALRTYLDRNRAQVVALSPWVDYDNYNAMTGKPATRAETKALMQEAYTAIKAVNPEIKVVGCIEDNWVTVPDGAAAPLLGTLKGKSSGNFPCTDEQMEILKNHTLRWQDCLLVTKQGRHLLELYYRGPDRLPMLAIAVCPAPGNSQHSYWLDQARFLMEDVGLDGLYIDQFNLAFSDLQRYSHDRWDGVTVDLDPATGAIARRYTDGAWASIGAQKSLADYVLGKGSYMVANTYPADPVMQAAGIHRFHEMEWGVDPRTWADGEEPPLMNRPCKGHLTTPIGLGYRPNFRGNRPEETADYAHTVMKAAIAYLRHGILYYPYANEIPETGPGAGEYGAINEMFPITPVELHKGWIIGEERIVTAVSGTFTWRQARRPDVLAFDLTGRAIEVKPEITKSERGWSVKIQLQDWQSIAVVR